MDALDLTISSHVGSGEGPDQEYRIEMSTDVPSASRLGRGKAGNEYYTTAVEVSTPTPRVKRQVEKRSKRDDPSILCMGDDLLITPDFTIVARYSRSGVL